MEKVDLKLQADHEEPPLTRFEVEELLEQVGGSEHLILRGRNLEGADLTNLRLMKTDLSGANLNKANLSGADLRGTDLRKTYLPRGVKRFEGTNLTGANLRGAYLFGVNFSGVNLSKADLSGAKLTQVDLSGANLSGATLTAASLSEAKLMGANLRNATLDEANLSRADLRGADLRGAKFDRTRLTEANLSGTHLSQVNLGGMDIFQPVLLPLIQALPNDRKTSIALAPSFRFRLVEEPLTPSTVIAGLSTVTELATKCWLIVHGRFAELIEYTQTRDLQFVEASQLHFTSITYNSPFDASFRLDMSASNVAEGIITALDGITQVKYKQRKAALENDAKAQEIAEAKQKVEREEQRAVIELERQALSVERERLDLLEKQLDLQKKAIEYALEIAARTVNVLHPDSNEQVKAMLIQALLPTLLQASNIKGLELVSLPEPNEEPPKGDPSE